MKQRITKEQLKEITEEQMKILAIEWTPEIGDHYMDVLNNDPKVYYITDIENISKPHLKNVPLLSIGQMIEYLQDSKKQMYLQGQHFYSPDLCDILWEEVKGTLSKGDS